MTTRRDVDPLVYFYCKQIAAAAEGGREAEGESESASESEASPGESGARASPCADDPSVCAVCKWGTLHTLRNCAELWKSFPCVGVFLIGYACTAPAVSSLLVLVSAWFVSKLKYSLTQVRRPPPSVYCCDYTSDPCALHTLFPPADVSGSVSPQRIRCVIRYIYIFLT